MSDIIEKEDVPLTSSGRFLLRMDPALHGRLKEEARAHRLSMNEYCVRKLASPGAPAEGPGTQAVERARSAMGDALVGVVLFGSWARDEARPDSDVDLLLVLEEKTPVQRSLYRGWDREPVSWKGHRLEPHYVHLPEAGAGPSGFWAEVAVDGLVLFEKDLRVSRRLAELRAFLAAGRMTRREIHGQPYWVEED